MITEEDVRISRRKALKRAAAFAVIAVPVLWSCERSDAPAPATSSGEGPAKVPKASVNYRDQPNGDKQCSKCTFFIAPNSCQRVEGTISPEGYCDLFTEKV